MSRYAVELTDAALSAIREQARYIAVDAQAPLNAERWIERIWDAVASLEHCAADPLSPKKTPTSNTRSDS